MRLKRMGHSPKITVRTLLAGDSAQATLEFALVAAVMLSLLLGLSALVSFVRGGALEEHAQSSASHRLSADGAALGDVILF